MLKQSKQGAHSNSTPAVDMPPMQKTVPDRERKFMGIMRDRSQDRDGDANSKSKNKKDKSLERETPVNKNNNTSTFFDFRQSSSRATDGFTKASKGLLSKITRGGSNHGKIPPVAVDDGEYVYRVVNLGLIDQTRLTRIAHSYDDCKDKTEFWMPALPWRAIE
jgi:hypothetical protein